MDGAQFEKSPCSHETNQIVESSGSAGTTSWPSGAPDSTDRQTSGSTSIVAAPKSSTSASSTPTSGRPGSAPLIMRGSVAEVAKQYG